MSIKELLKKNEAIHKFGVLVKKKFSPKQDKIMEEIMTYYEKRFFKYAGAFNESEVKAASYMTWLYHVIEKGLSMPNMRLGFGKEKLMELCSVIDDFETKYGGEGKAFYSAISVLGEYVRVHQELNYEIESELLGKINSVLLKHPDIMPINQKEITKDQYFSSNDLPFNQFSYSRHCVRNFDSSKSIDVSDLIQSIDLAKNAPSACNRQPVRVHIVTDKKLMLSCLEMQNGSRGFRELADKLLIVTGDLRTVLGAQEFFDLNTNVGIFIMNLCYSLQVNEIGCCILNWYAMPKDDIKLRKIVDIPDEENVVAFIICGKLPDRLKLAESPRLETDKIYTIHS